MQFIKKEHKKFGKNNYHSFILAGDVGGTNTNLGIFGIKNKSPRLLLTFLFQSKELNGLHEAINETLAYVLENYKIKITNSCLAVAGYLSAGKDYAKVTNIKWDVNRKNLLKKTTLKKILLLNDFEAIGYGINLLGKKDIYVIKKAEKIPKAPIVVIGPGTGLGKTTLIYNNHQKSYVPVASEAGHSDFAAQTDEELKLVNFIKKHKKIKHGISYEQVLSGQGLVNIYLFLRNSKNFKPTEYTKEIDDAKEKPYLISKYRKLDKTCGATFKIFKRINAKFARNFALDCIAFGGVYIAGGIAAKNIDIFDREFVKTFEENYMLAEILRKTPIYLILNFNVGLLGAGFFGARFLRP